MTWLVVSALAWLALALVAGLALGRLLNHADALEERSIRAAADELVAGAERELARTSGEHRFPNA